ncbi:hypothetical protein Aperf_G00000126132 [Anoplocephala perfoliata]
MQRFFGISKISDSFLELCLLSSEGSAVEKLGRREVFPDFRIIFMEDNYQVTLVVRGRGKAEITVKNAASDEFPTFCGSFVLPEDFDPRSAAKNVIGKLENAIELTNSLIACLSKLFDVTNNQAHPACQLWASGKPVEVKLKPDYSHVSISIKDNLREFSLDNLDASKIIGFIRSSSSESQSGVDAKHD